MSIDSLPELFVIVGGNRKSFHSRKKAAEFAAERFAAGEKVSYATNAATEFVGRQRISALKANVKYLLAKQGISYS